MPLGENFWTAYAEPVADFIRGAVAFAQAAKHLGATKKATRQEGLRTLHAMTGAVRVAVEPGPNTTYQQRWRSPSLLASFALMLLQDLAKNRHVRQCPATACGQVFAAASYQTVYCSVTCRNRMQKRRYRAKKKTAARPKKQTRRTSTGSS